MKVLYFLELVWKKNFVKTNKNCVMYYSVLNEKWLHLFQAFSVFIAVVRIIIVALPAYNVLIINNTASCKRSRLLLCNCLQGLCTGFIGPLFTALQDQVGIAVAEVSRVFVGHATGSLAGSLLGCFTSDSAVWSVFMLLLLGVGIALIPWSTNLFLLVGLFAVQGFASGALQISKLTCCVFSVL
jgi:hypothetical protein